jgi:hypothetical protein
VPKAINNLAGHSTLNMTLRYMHRAPSRREAIGLLVGTTHSVTV